MNGRRVRVPGGGRQVYGRAQPLRPVRRRGAQRPKLSPLGRRVLVLVAILVAVGFGVWRLFAVTAVVVKSPERAGEIQTEAQKAMASSWRLQNLLTLDGEEFASKLQQADPILKTVTVRRKWLHTVIISADMKQPSLGWSSGNQGYLLDRDGTAIGLLTGGSPLPVVADGSNLPVQMGAKVVPARFVSFVTALVPALSSEGIKVTALSVKETTLDLEASTDKGYQLLFDTSRSVGDEMADFRAVRKLLTTQKKTPAEYIDLRISGKAYYK